MESYISCPTSLHFHALFLHNKLSNSTISNKFRGKMNALTNLYKTSANIKQKRDVCQFHLEVLWKFRLQSYNAFTIPRIFPISLITVYQSRNNFNSFFLKTFWTMFKDEWQYLDFRLWSQVRKADSEWKKYFRNAIQLLRIQIRIRIITNLIQNSITHRNLSIKMMEINNYCILERKI